MRFIPGLKSGAITGRRSATNRMPHDSAKNHVNWLILNWLILNWLKLNWLKRFFNDCFNGDLGAGNEADMKRFLTELAVDGNVAVSTQRQAMSALLFFYQRVLGRELEFLDICVSDKTRKLPVVLNE